VVEVDLSSLPLTTLSCARRRSRRGRRQDDLDHSTCFRSFITIE